MIELRKIKLQKFLPFLVSAVLLFLFLNSKVIEYQHSGDEQENIVAGWLIKKGKIPYRDFFFHHTPLPFFISAFLQLLSNNFLIHRYFMLGFFILMFLYLYRNSEKKLKYLLFPTFFIFISIVRDHMTLSFMADNFSAVSVFAIFFVFANYLIGKIKLRKVVLHLGAFSFISVWSSYTSVLSIGFLVLSLAILSFKKVKTDFKKLNKKVFLIFLVHLIFPIYFVVNKAFGDFWWANLIYNQKYYFPMRLAENGMELKYGVFYRIISQFIKYVRKEGGVILNSFLIFFQTLKSQLINIFRLNFWEGIWIAIVSLVKNLSSIETASFLVVFLIILQLGKKLRWKAFFILGLWIFLRSRTSELIHLNLFYLVVIFGFFYIFYESLKEKKIVFSLLNFLCLIVFVNIIFSQFSYVLENKDSFVNSGVIETSENIKSYGENQKLLLLNGDTMIYCLSENELANKYFYYYPWFHNVSKMRNSIEKTILNKEADVIIFDGLGRQNFYAKDLLPLIEDNYKNVESNIFIKL